MKITDFWNMNLKKKVGTYFAMQIWDHAAECLTGLFDGLISNAQWPI